MAKVTFETAALALAPQRHGVRWAGGGRSGLSGDVRYELADGGGFTVTVDDAKNMAPFMSSLPWTTGNPDWATINYTDATRKGYITDDSAADGWATLVFDPAGDTGTLAMQIMPKPRSGLVAGTELTLMIEFADFSAPQTDAQITVYHGVNNQQIIRKGTAAAYVATISEGVTRLPMVVNGISNPTRLVQVQIRNNNIPSEKWTGKVRFSLWEKGYEGAYLPYEG